MMHGPINIRTTSNSVPKYFPQIEHNVLALQTSSTEVFVEEGSRSFLK
jgi:hypothetical protein